MTDQVLSGCGPAHGPIREAVCIHTKKIFDSCKDKDCVEDLRLYLTGESQIAIDGAVSVRARSAELLHCSLDVEEVSYNRGYFTIDVRFFYKIHAEAITLLNRPVPITGLATFDKRVLLFGSEGGAKVFTSGTILGGTDEELAPVTNLPTAVCEALDPIVLDIKIVDACENRCDCGCGEVPGSISGFFDCPLDCGNPERRVYVSLGQFSIIRLERDTQLLMPSYDYCVPEKECVGNVGDDACTLFSRINFPVDSFFPPNNVAAPEGFRSCP